MLIYIGFGLIYLCHYTSTLVGHAQLGYNLWNLRQGHLYRLQKFKIESPNQGIYKNETQNDRTYF